MWPKATAAAAAAPPPPTPPPAIYHYSPTNMALLPPPLAHLSPLFVATFASEGICVSHVVWARHFVFVLPSHHTFLCLCLWVCGCGCGCGCYTLIIVNTHTDTECPAFLAFVGLNVTAHMGKLLLISSCVFPIKASPSATKIPTDSIRNPISIAEIAIDNVRWSSKIPIIFQITQQNSDCGALLHSLSY